MRESTAHGAFNRNGEIIMIRLRTTFALAAIPLAACSSDDTTSDGNPPESGQPQGGSGQTAPQTATADIVQTASEAGQFTTLIAAVQAAGLEDTLRGPGPFTVFAPTDEAFAKLPAGTLDTLLKPENREQLASILTYHVIAGKVPSSEAVKLTSAKTVNGKELKLDASSGSLKVDNATVAKADIEASNGIIHVIDTVVLPE